MATNDRRVRERNDQRRLILGAARSLAEDEGWAAVTTRRLATEIEYSQPVIYKHFASLNDLTAAVALEGFDELSVLLRDAREESPSASAAEAVVRAYLSFAEDNPALYEAMFSRETALAFGDPDAPSPMAEAFSQFARAVSPAAGSDDVATFAEVLWAALHGLVLLTKDGRLREEHAGDRLAVLLGRFAAE